jgi:hypothetical protein
MRPRLAKHPKPDPARIAVELTRPPLVKATVDGMDKNYYKNCSIAYLY